MIRIAASKKTAGVPPPQRAPGSQLGSAHRPWAVTGAVIGLIALLILNSVAMGLRVAPVGHPPYLVPAELDYNWAPLKALAPLRDFFIERILGRSIVQAKSAAEGRHTSSRRGSRPASAAQGPQVIAHPLTNDSFEDAYPISSLPFRAKTNTTAAGREGEEPTQCAPVGGTVWYRYIAAEDVGLIADTFGTDHPVSLSVLSGSEMKSLQEVGCTTHPRGNARVAFPATKGETYFFQVATVRGGELLFSLRPQGTTKRVPIPSGYTGFYTGLSLDGRYISLWAAESVAGGPSSRCAGILHGLSPAPSAVCRAQAFLYDRTTEKTVMVSVNSKGEQANDSTAAGTVSADGRYVPIGSWASNLVEGDTNTCPRFSWLPGSCLDIFVHDRDADGNGVFDETFRGARKMVRVSVASDGTQSNGNAGPGYMSPDGRYVFFQSWATNLVEDDTNGVGDVFRHDRDADGNGIFDETFPGARETTRVSVASDGSQTNANLRRAAEHQSVLGGRDMVPFEVGNHYVGPSANGRYVMFRSPATNLDPRCTNGAYHVYVHDSHARTTTCVSLSSDERQANKGTRLINAFAYKVSDDGRFAIFNSDATNLVENDTNGEEDVFVRDLVRGTTERVSMGWDGRQARGESTSSGREFLAGLVLTTLSVAIFEDIYILSELQHSMTPDGRYFFFGSGADNLVPGDLNEARDVFVRDRHRGTTTMLSASSSGAQGDLSSNGGTPTADGRLVFFMSWARNLDDANPDPEPGLSPHLYLRSLPGGP